MERYTLLIDGYHGVHIPQIFAQSHDMDAWHVNPLDALILTCGVDWITIEEDERHDSAHTMLREKLGPDYLDDWPVTFDGTWIDVLDTAYTVDGGIEHTLYLGESGDLFAERGMTHEEIAVEIAEENNFDADAFSAFCENIHTDLTDEYQADQAVKGFEDAFIGIYDDAAEWAEEYGTETYEIPKGILNYIEWERFADDAQSDGSVYELDLPNGKVAMFYNS